MLLLFFPFGDLRKKKRKRKRKEKKNTHSQRQTTESFSYPDVLGRTLG